MDFELLTQPFPAMFLLHLVCLFLLLGGPIGETFYWGRGFLDELDSPRVGKAFLVGFGLLE